MTKTEALAALDDGKKVSHKLYQPHEWLKKLHSGSFQTEDGYVMPRSTFNINYQSHVWDEGWEIFEEKPLSP